MKDSAYKKIAEELSNKDAGNIELVGLTDFGKWKIARFRLKNGLEVLILPDDSAPVVNFQTWFRVGSRHEQEGKTGLAHLFEHLMFNETETLKAGEFDRKLEASGADTNAGTSVDYTHYYESVTSDRLPLVIKMEADRMQRLVLREPQVASEKEVVANERRYVVEDDVDGSASELLYKTAFTDHPYRWPTIGWMRDIQAFTPSDCEAFYKTFYAPNNAFIVIVGDINVRAVLKSILGAYGAIPRAEIPPEDITPDAPQMSERRVVLRKPTPAIKVIVGYRGPALGDADHATLVVLNEILLGGRASRAFRSLFIRDELVSDLRGWVSAFKHPGLYEISLTGRTDVGAEKLLSAIDEELEKVLVDCVTQEELERAVARVELSLVQTLETMSGKAEQIGLYEVLVGQVDAPFRKLEQMQRLTPSDLRIAARRYLRKEARTIVIVEPSAEDASEVEDPELASGTSSSAVSVADGAA